MSALICHVFLCGPVVLSVHVCSLCVWMEPITMWMWMWTWHDIGYYFNPYHPFAFISAAFTPYIHTYTFSLIVFHSIFIIKHKNELELCVFIFEHSIFYYSPTSVPSSTVYFLYLVMYSVFCVVEYARAQLTRTYTNIHAAHLYLYLNKTFNETISIISGCW